MLEKCEYKYCPNEAIVRTLGIIWHCQQHHSITIEKLITDFKSDIGRNQSLKSRTLMHLLDVQEASMKISAVGVADKFNISYPTASKYLKELEREGILKPVGSGNYVKV